MLKYHCIQAYSEVSPVVFGGGGGGSFFFFFKKKKQFKKNFFKNPFPFFFEIQQGV